MKLDRGDLEVLGESPHSPRCCPIYADLVRVAAYTGLRLGELLALTREDVDLPGRRLNIRATLTELLVHFHAYRIYAGPAGISPDRSC